MEIGLQLDKFDIKCGNPYFASGEPSDALRAVRKEIMQSVGYDFLGTAGDMWRPASMVSSKTGVAFFSNHKTGRAIDYDQNSKKYIICPEQINGKTYFRTFLKCETIQVTKSKFNVDERKTVNIWSAGKLIAKTLPANEWFDLTECFEFFGFERIPAWSRWKLTMGYSTMMEFWHYQYMHQQGKRLTWQEAMDYLRKSKTVLESEHPLAPKTLTPKNPILRQGDSDGNTFGRVTDFQKILSAVGYLNPASVDGFFGVITYGAVKNFQEHFGLDTDGVVGAKTWDKLLTENTRLLLA